MCPGWVDGGIISGLPSPLPGCVCVCICVHARARVHVLVHPLVIRHHKVSNYLYTIPSSRADERAHHHCKLPGVSWDAEREGVFLHLLHGPFASPLLSQVEGTPSKLATPCLSKRWRVSFSSD